MTHVPTSLSKRLGFAFLGLLAGNAILFVFLMTNAIRNAVILHVARVGAPAAEITIALEVFLIYAACSFAGWIIVGLPTVLFIPARVLLRFGEMAKIVIGAALGPLALFLIFVLLSRGHVSTFARTGVLWIYASVISTAAFWVYVALLKRRVGRV